MNNVTGRNYSVVIDLNMVLSSSGVVSCGRSLV